MFKKYEARIDHLFRAVGSAFRQNMAAEGKNKNGEPIRSAKSERRFHYLMIMLIIVLLIGGSIDGYYHVFFGFKIESFFILPHYLMYGAWCAIFLSVVVYASLQSRKGKNMAHWLPPRYALTALGAVLLGIAGPLDIISHALLGFEFNLQVLLSPAHLILFLAFGLIYSGVLSHAVYQLHRYPHEHQNSFRTSLPLLIGLVCLLNIVIWPAWYFDPLAADYASKGAIVGVRDAYNWIDYGSPTAEVAGVEGIVLTTLILVPFVILPLNRWRLPSGSLLFVLGSVFVQRAIIVGVYSYLPAILGAALAGELIWAWMRRGGEARLSSPLGYRILGFSVPFILFSLYFLTVSFMPNGVIWPATLWTGSIWMAAGVGVLLSLIIIPGKANAEKIA